MLSMFMRHHFLLGWLAMYTCAGFTILRTAIGMLTGFCVVWFCPTAKGTQPHIVDTIRLVFHSDQGATDLISLLSLTNAK